MVEPMTDAELADIRAAVEDGEPIPADLVAEILARLDRAEAAGAWRPIESAPKDGTWVLLGGCVGGPSVRLGQWSRGAYNRSTKSYDKDWVDYPAVALRPTHWQPLPPLPAQRRREMDREALTAMLQDNQDEYTFGKHTLHLLGALFQRQNRMIRNFLADPAPPAPASGEELIDAYKAWQSKQPRHVPYHAFEAGWNAALSAQRPSAPLAEVTEAELWGPNVFGKGYPAWLYRQDGWMGMPEGYYALRQKDGPPIILAPVDLVARSAP